MQRAGEEVPTVMTAAVRADRSEFRGNEPGLGIRNTAAVPLRFPAGDRPSGIDDDVGPAGAIDIRIPVGRQPISDLVAQFVVSQAPLLLPHLDRTALFIVAGRCHSSGSDLPQVALPVPRWAAQQLGVASGSAQIQVRW